MPQCEPPRSPGKLNVGCTVQPGNSQYFFLPKSLQLSGTSELDALASAASCCGVDVMLEGLMGEAVAEDTEASSGSSKGAGTLLFVRRHAIAGDEVAAAVLVFGVTGSRPPSSTPRALTSVSHGLSGLTGAECEIASASEACSFVIGASIAHDA